PTGVGPVSGQVVVPQCTDDEQCGAVSEKVTIDVTATGVSSVVSAPAPYWRGWNIARGVVLTRWGDSGYVVDGDGGLHRFSNPGVQLPETAQLGAYWPGWDIARGVALFADGSGGYVVDGFGGLHAFRVGAAAMPPPARGPYWPGRDVVRGVALNAE